MHICGEEVAAFVSCLPFVGMAWTWLRNKLKRNYQSAAVRCTLHTND